MYRLFFLTLALGGLLMAAFAPAQANRTPLPSMNSTAASAMIHEHAAVSGGVPLTEAEMQRLTAGQGCFGLAGIWFDDDPTCCTTARGVMYSPITRGLFLPIAITVTSLAAVFYYSSCV